VNSSASPRFTERLSSRAIAFSTESSWLRRRRSFLSFEDSDIASRSSSRGKSLPALRGRERWALRGSFVVTIVAGGPRSVEEKVMTGVDLARRSEELRRIPAQSVVCSLSPLITQRSSREHKVRVVQVDHHE
jgi:hypothetical protein